MKSEGRIPPQMPRHPALDLAGPREWQRLTSVPGKAEVFGRDVFMRESWASFVDGLEGERRAQRFIEQVALVWLRPDAFAAGVTRHVLAAADAAGFRALAARPVRLERCGVRSLWAYAARCATAEGLWLLEAIAALGRGLLVLYVDERWGPDGPSATVRMTEVKGAGDPTARAPGTLRDVAGSPNPALTMVHAADEGADLVRELGVFLPWVERRHLIVNAARRLETGARCPLDQAVADVDSEFVSLGTEIERSSRSGSDPEHVDHLLVGTLERRWAGILAAAERWRLFSAGPVTGWWSEPVTS